MGNNSEPYYRSNSCMVDMQKWSEGYCKIDTMCQEVYADKPTH